MENKRVVPVWVSVVLSILLAFGAIANIYYTIATNGLALWEIITDILYFISYILAFAYCLKGYSKNGAAFFNVFCIFYCLACMIPIFGDAELYQGGSVIITLLLILHLISFACLSIFSVARDLGKKKSFVLAGIVLACTLIIAVIGFTVSIPFLLSMSGNIILSIIFFIMIYAKYKDKAARGTK